MIPETDAGSIGQRLVEGARALYADLTDQLRRALEQLKRDYLTDEAKGLAEAIKSHRKALQTLLDFELGFAKSTEGAKTSNDLDLTAAKTEVLGRLDRLVAARRVGGAD